MQQGILVDYLSARHTGAYIQQLLGSIEEPLDRERFQSAWQHLSERHSSLRICFQLKSGKPLQIIADPFRVVVEFVNWQDVCDAALEQTLVSFMEADRQRGFNLNEAPLFRVTVLELSERRYQFVWTSHHLLFDGRSRFRLLKEFYSLYENVQKWDTDSADGSYCDFVERCWRPPKTEAKRFWRDAWPIGIDEHTVVEALRECSSDRKPGYRSLQRSLDSPLTDAIKRQSRQLAIGESTLFHAAWALLSSRYTRTGWSVFGVTRSCRDSETADLVGLCVNTIPLGLNIEPRDTVSSFVQRARKRWRALDSFEHSSINDIRKWRGNRHRLFDAILNFESYELNEKLRQAGTEWLNRDFKLFGTTNLPLVLSINSGHQYKLELVYDRSVLDDSTAASLYGQYATVLYQLTGPGDQLISDFKLVSEQAFYMLTRPGQVKTHTVEQSVSERFHGVVDSHHNAIALSYGSRNLTYGELDRDATQITATLLGQGIQPGMRVGVLIDRSFEMVAAWVGILRTGAAYVPLDPRFPDERTQYMVRDVDVALIIADPSYAHIARRLDAKVVFTDSLDGLPDAIPERAYPSDPEAAAYIMYTSGSTGEPKGVVIPQRGIMRLVCDNDYIPFGPERVFLLHSSVVFDASTLEVWGALLNGARCVILEGEGTEIGPLGDTIRSRGVDCLWLTSSLFNLIVEDCLEVLKGIKYLMIGGEDLSVPHVTKALDALPDTQVINGYGPTESTTFSCTYPIPRDFDRDRQRVPIGKPIRHTHVYIVDSADMPVPKGCPGELVIGGAGLALGYWNQARLTKERFVEDPFCEAPGRRIYRSGDRCRWLDDGEIEFLGRFDDQQKVRGFRVEPGEINTVLVRHPLVANAATLAVPLVSGGKQLESWVTLSRPVATADKVLKTYLAEQLPYFSIPSHINVVDRLPLTLSGKVDRAKLISDRQRLKTTNTTAPQQGLIGMLQSIWEEVLDTTGVDPDSNFFDLGGDSLSAARMLQRVEEKLSVSFPLSKFLDASTVKSLADSLTIDANGFSEQRNEASTSREEFML